MLLDSYQDQSAATDALDAAGDDPLVSLLGLGARVGHLLDVYKQYLRDLLSTATAQHLIAENLGALLWYTAAVASRHDLRLSDIARHNIDKTAHRALARGRTHPPRPRGRLTFEAYQQWVGGTDDHADGQDLISSSVPMLGLIGEAGNLLNAQKKYYSDGEPMTRDAGFVRTELGDLLWYIASVANHWDLAFGAIAQSNLSLNAKFNPARADAPLPDELPVLDEEFPATERFPRRVVIRFRGVKTLPHEPAKTAMTLLEAVPNAFPDGPAVVGTTPSGKDKLQGFTVGGPLGDPLTDNSPQPDGYRYHDAIHLGFLAVLGWSPTQRALLRLKRRSDSRVNEDQDGARALFAEEGIAAILAKRALARNGFRSDKDVDTHTLELVTSVFEHLEVACYEPWIWRRAISQGFTAMQALNENGGSGYAVLDLDERTVRITKTRPRPV